MKRAILAVVCGFVFAVGCASGTDGLGDDGDGAEPDAGDSHVVIDANNNLPIDARPIDASIPIDASLPIDASSGGLDIGASCTASAQCLSGCCFGGLSVCFEDPGIPGACI